jgi:hypothetical protein
MANYLELISNFISDTKNCNIFLVNKEKKEYYLNGDNIAYDIEKEGGVDLFINSLILILNNISNFYDDGNIMIIGEEKIKSIFQTYVLKKELNI